MEWDAQEYNFILLSPTLLVDIWTPWSKRVWFASLLFKLEYAH